MTAQLRQWGFIVGKRDPRLNTRFSGAFMVCESFEPAEVPTKDGSNGPWCIVGDDLTLLVEQAYGVWADEYL